MIEGFFRHWQEYFEWNASEPDTFPWQARDSLSEKEKKLVGASVASYVEMNGCNQNVGSERASVFGEKMGFKIPPEIMRLFLAEGCNHTELLTRFLERQCIAKPGSGWKTKVFHMLRKRAGYGTSLSTMVNAKLIGLIFYRALREATGSRLLRALCNKLLEDEKSQVEFQSAMVRFSQGRLDGPRRFAWRLAMRVLFEYSMFIVFLEHRVLLEKGGYPFLKFLPACRVEFRRYFPGAAGQSGMTAAMGASAPYA